MLNTDLPIEGFAIGVGRCRRNCAETDSTGQSISAQIGGQSFIS